MTDRPTIALLHDPADPLATAEPVRRARALLEHALTGHGLAVQPATSQPAPAADALLVLAGADTALARTLLTRAGVTLPPVPEALAMVPGHLDGRPALLLTGTDARGLAYAVHDLADRLVHAPDPWPALALDRPLVERPANPIRGILRPFVSQTEDRPWFSDRAFWPPYFAMLAAQRFNRFHLALGLGYDFLRDVRDAYFLFPYPFLLSVPGFAVRAVDLPETERAENLALLRFISDEAAAWGLDFCLGLWTHGCQWHESPQANYHITGLTPDTHAAYCRAAIAHLLQACPNIRVVTLRVHGESGIPEGHLDFWRAVFQGIVESGQPVALDLHPKGVDRALIDLALATGLPVTLSPKYSAEHMGLPGHQLAIRALERTGGLPEGDAFVRRLMARSGGDLRYTRYGYADFLTTDRSYGLFFRVWPGTQRLLLWGDPALAAGFGRQGTFGGALGIEFFEPLSFKGRRGSGLPGGRDGYADPSLRPARDWEKYRYTYRLWGRLLYNPQADPDTWRRALRAEFGPAAAPAETALAAASRILPLVTVAHHPSAANNRYWPELYTPIALEPDRPPHPYRDTPSPRVLATVSPLDPALFTTIAECVAELLAGQPSGRYTPLQVARWLDALARTAEDQNAALLASAPDPQAPAVRRWTTDVAILAALGRFFAAWLRTGVAVALLERTGDPAWLATAMVHGQAARAAWARAAEAAAVYREDLTFGPEPWLRGHWRDRLSALEAILATLAARQSPDGPVAPADLERLVPPPPDWTVQHAAPATFRPGQPLRLTLTVGASDRLTVTLHYRPLNQALAYRTLPLTGEGDRYQVTIPAAETQTSYPLQYYFVLRDDRGRAALFPGLGPDLANAPGFVVWPARA